MDTIEHRETGAFFVPRICWKGGMNMAGRKPKPTAVKKLEGNPGKRKLNSKEPVPAKQNPADEITFLLGAGFTMVPFGQGFARMSTPTKEFYRLLMEKKIVHAGHSLTMESHPQRNVKQILQQMVSP